MPELPDAECFRRVVADHALGRRIAAVRLRDPERLKGAREDDLHAALEGRSFEATRRHGKVALARAGEGRWIVFHFGMTGFLTAYDDEADEPSHARLVVDFDDGGHLAFDNLRKFGWVEIAEDPDDYIAREGLGPDALAVGQSDFAGIIGGSGGMVKSMLMDQGKIAGVGNVYSDEILFQSGVAPDAKASGLSSDRLRTIHETMRKVLRTAIEAGAHPHHMPQDWLTPHRGEEGAACPRCGGPLTSRKVSGRTAYLCPSCQSA